MLPRTLLVIAAFCVWPASAGAGPLAPKRPSEVLTLVASYTTTTCPDGGGNGIAFDTVVTSDAAYAPLVIPPKHVLVLTALRWFHVGPPNEEFLLQLRPGPEAAGFTGVTLPGARSDATGRASGQVSLDPGIIVRSLQSFCLRMQTSAGLSTPGNVSATGFLAKDR